MCSQPNRDPHSELFQYGSRLQTVSVSMSSVNTRSVCLRLTAATTKHKNQTLHPPSSLCGRGSTRCEVLQDKGVKDRVSRWFSAAIISYYHQYLFLPISSWCCYICTWKIAMWTDDFKLEGPFKIQSNNLI